MIQFKPVAKTSEIKVLNGTVIVGRILADSSGQRQYRQECGSTLAAPDLLRVLRQMGVTVPAGAEAKIETAVTQQLAVQSSARALRLGRQVSAAAPVKAKRKYVRKAKAIDSGSQGSPIARVVRKAAAKTKAKAKKG